MHGRTRCVLLLTAALGLGATPLGCGSDGDPDPDPAADAGRQDAERYSVRFDTARPERLVAEVQPKEPWTLDMDFASVVVLGDARAQPADRISAGRIVFDVPRATGAESPRTGTLRFSVCGEGGCEPVEHTFRTD